MEIIIVAGILLAVVMLAVLLIRSFAPNRESEVRRLAQEQLERDLERLEKTVRDEIARNRSELNQALRDNRQELTNSFKLLGDTQRQHLETFSQQLHRLTQSSGEGLEKIRASVDTNLKNLQADNTKKLDEMRQVVDEKLRESVEKRFNESFKLISERLDQVHKGLGEMQSLASGVGDLKKVLTNVKTRGNLGEIQLANILEQCLSPEQYDTNVAVKPGSAERVEFAIRMPGKDPNDLPIYLPVDSKFPVEDYQRLLEAYDRAGQVSPAELETILKSFETAVRKNARDIHDKYIDPPHTTDFAIMFVPTEGLYAEILRRHGLFESLNRDLKIAVVGPANLVAFLNSLQMGFRTLAIEKRSSEVWNVLGAIKTEFGKFGDVLEKTRQKLVQATNVIDQANVRTRVIQRKLRTVQELPAEESARILSDTLDIEPLEPESSGEE